MTDLQYIASDPLNSVWVAASAGTGKTKILTDRVLRLLINDVQPQKILCLTFTNAAAGEMQERIYDKLSFWAKSEDSTLIEDLSILIGSKFDRNKLDKVRSIYHCLLDNINKINIYTIHSFCQKILKAFPIEAGITPGFKVIDDITSKAILAQLKTEIYSNPENQKITNFIAANFHDSTVNDIINEVIDNRLKFQEFVGRFHSLHHHPLDHTNTAQPTKDHGIYKQLLRYSPHHELPTIKSVTDALAKLINDFENPIQMPNDIIKFFLTDNGDKRKSLINKKMTVISPAFEEMLQIIQHETYKVDQANKTERLLEYSRNVVDLGVNFISIYDEYKRRKNVLDYDDLIFYTKELLSTKATKDWVLYKLDGGMEHLLVDEAQDTSTDQWQIIQALIAEFYSGDGSNSSEHRTVFVVGDDKQSIFSFQGAQVDSFNNVKNDLKIKLSHIGKNFHIINLDSSYRACDAILRFTHKVFADIKSMDSSLFAADNRLLLAKRTNTEFGTVELWPLVKPVQTPELFWPMPEAFADIKTPTTILASQIAQYIADKISTNYVIPSTGLPARACDFMILIRKRDTFVQDIIKELRNYNLQSTGIDRIILNEDLAIIDLISAAKFVLNPHDDLNLAHLLKSSIISVDEKDLYHIATSRGSLSIWQFISDNASSGQYRGFYDTLNILLDLYDSSHVGNFFHIILDRFGLRDVLLNLNGQSSDDAINELLYTSYNYSNNIDISLQSFVYWFENNTIEIKRNLESSDKIRIMTVHGSKGLQAPIVILCDTTTSPTSKNKFIWADDNIPLYSMAQQQAPQILKDIKERKKFQELQEYLRLLYVAITRAQDHLVICGYQLNNNQLNSYCWYQLLVSSMQNLGCLDKNGILVYGNLQHMSTTDYSAKQVSLAHVCHC